MERKVGEIFEYEGHKLKVVEEVGTECHKCFLFSRDCKSSDIRGACWKNDRTDNKSVIFVEVKDEQLQQQAEQSQELNLCEILKNYPKGWKFWSPMLGDVKLYDIIQSENIIIIEAKNRETWEINSDGTMNIGDIISPEIMLYPSREQRDWSKFTATWLKKDKFNPKTLQPFDKVIVRDGYREIWLCSIFSNIIEEAHPYCTASGRYLRCIPYNEDTKHLVGTTEEAPEFYKYWED